MPSAESAVLIATVLGWQSAQSDEESIDDPPPSDISMWLCSHLLGPIQWSNEYKITFSIDLMQKYNVPRS